MRPATGTSRPTTAASGAGAGAKSTLVWHKVETSVQPYTHRPEGRSGHAAFTLGAGDKRIFIHGGGADSIYFHNCFSLHTGTGKWGAVHFYRPPRARAYHTLLIVGPSTTPRDTDTPPLPRVLCYGGVRGGGGLEGDVEMMDEWRVIKDVVENGSSIIAAASASSGLSALKLVGGGKHARRRDDAEPPEGQTEDVWNTVATSGDVPLARCSHTFTLVGSSHAVMFGGWHGGFVDQVYVLDLHNATWSYRRPSVSPPPRAAHATVLLPGRILLVIGGQNADGQLGDVWALDLTLMEWREVECDSGKNSMSARSGHTAVYDGKGRVYMYGGWDGSRHRDDTYVLNVEQVADGSAFWEDALITGAKGQFFNDVHYLETNKATEARGQLKQAVKKIAAATSAGAAGNQLANLTKTVVREHRLSQDGNVERNPNKPPLSSASAAAALLLSKRPKSAGLRPRSRARTPGAGVDDDVDASLESALRVMRERSKAMARRRREEEAVEREREERKGYDNSEGSGVDFSAPVRRRARRVVPVAGGRQWGHADKRPPPPPNEEDDTRLKEGVVVAEVLAVQRTGGLLSSHRRKRIISTRALAQSQQQPSFGGVKGVVRPRRVWDRDDDGNGDVGDDDTADASQSAMARGRDDSVLEVLDSSTWYCQHRSYERLPAGTQQAAVTIQKCARGFLQRKHYRQDRAVVIVQAHLRGWRTRRHLGLSGRLGMSVRLGMAGLGRTFVVRGAGNGAAIHDKLHRARKMGTSMDYTELYLR
eukprot:jgi/Chlat1/8817/Chrsp90S08145